MKLKAFLIALAIILVFSSCSQATEGFTFDNTLSDAGDQLLKPETSSPTDEETTENDSSVDSDGSSVSATPDYEIGNSDSIQAIFDEIVAIPAEKRNETYVIAISSSVTDDKPYDFSGDGAMGDFTYTGETPLHIILQSADGSPVDLIAKMQKRVLKINGKNLTVTLKENVTLTGGASVKGAGVSVQQGAFIMDGGEISSNSLIMSTATKEFFGAGVFVANGASFIMKGGFITNNTIPSYMTTAEGGGVYVEAGGIFEILPAASVVQNSPTDIIRK